MSLEIENIEKQLPLWIAANQNVLAIGRHGVGKTSLFINAFEAAKLRYMYFSASTMDPWVDFIGVPRAVQRPDGTSVLELIRPQPFQDDQIQAILFDEFNRSHKKVRNAVMELIQFKSINGRKFKNLRLVWAIINPEDDEGLYDVERLDPAQRDRFQQRVEFPYECNIEYFKKKYLGQFSESSIKGALEWWKDLPKEIQANVSPRRLDVALETAVRGGELRYVLDASTHIGKLIGLLKGGSVEDNLSSLLSHGNTEGATRYLNVENNYNSAIPIILQKDEMKAFFLPLLEKEKLASLMSEHGKVLDLVANGVNEHPIFAEVVKEQIEARTGKVTANLSRRLKHKDVTELPDILKEYSDSNMEPITEVAAPVFANAFPKTNKDYMARLQEATDIASKDVSQTDDRTKAYTLILSNIPGKMTEEEIKGTMNVLAILCKRSHFKALRRLWTNFLGVLNHVSLQMKFLIESKQNKSSIDTTEESIKTRIMRDYGKEFKEIVGQLKSAKMDGGFCFSNWF